MSSSSNITGLLASLINGTTEASSPLEGARRRAPTSLSRALNDSRIRAASNDTYSQTNVTKKAIVLKYIESDPNPNQTDWWRTNWVDVMKDSLPSFGVSEITVDAIAQSGITNYPQYRVWILPDNTNSAEIYPMIDDGEITNVNAFPICNVKDFAMTERLVVGALIRIDFENRLLENDAYITNVINNNEEFGRAIFNELGGVISPREACEACGDSRPATSHYRGHAIPAGGSASGLHNAYVAESREAGEHQIDSAALYSILESRLGDSKLALGILANAVAESNLNANVISGVATESSIGLWQMNVQNEGWIDVPKSSMMTQARSLPDSIQIPSTSNVIVYFAGGQLAKKHGVVAVTPVDYTGGNHDVGEVYEIVSDSTKQIDFVVEAAQNMLATITYNSADITAGDWAQWWQIYFEQPAAIHNRRAHAQTIKDDLGLSVVV